MEPEDSVHLDLTSLDRDEHRMRDCVVVRGFNPGVKSQFDTIVDTYRLNGAVALRFSSEESALRYWKHALSVGNEVVWLGSGSVEERLAYRDTLCRRLITHGTVISSTPRASPSPRGRPVRRTDSISVPSSLRSPPPSPGPVRSPAPISVMIAPPHQPADPLAASLAAAGVISYAPPSTEGVAYRPRNLPADYVCRGKRSQHAWYVAWKNRRPGIYCDWDHVVAAHDDCPREHVTVGHMTYHEAIAQWVTLRDSNKIKCWA